MLVFSSSRAGCEADALLISRVLPAWAELEEETREKRLDLLGGLRSNVATGLDPRLGMTVLAGVGFHRGFFILLLTILILFGSGEELT